jgi:hypothetical protein
MTDTEPNNNGGGGGGEGGKKIDEKRELWWEAFPQPKSSVPELTGDEVMTMFDDMDIKPEPRSFLLVDVRRTDWEVRSISLPMTLPRRYFIGDEEEEV